jgi:hypothetical protein
MDNARLSCGRMQSYYTTIIENSYASFNNQKVIGIVDALWNTWNFPNWDGKHVDNAALASSGAFYFSYKKIFCIAGSCGC